MPGVIYLPNKYSKKSVKLKQENKVVELKLVWNRHKIRGFSLLEDFMSGVSKIALSESCVLFQVAAIYHKLPLKTFPLIRPIYLKTKYCFKSQ